MAISNPKPDFIWRPRAYLRKKFGNEGQFGVEDCRKSLCGLDLSGNIPVGFFRRYLGDLPETIQHVATIEVELSSQPRGRLIGNDSLFSSDMGQDCGIAQ